MKEPCGEMMFFQDFLQEYQDYSVPLHRQHLKRQWLWQSFVIAPRFQVLFFCLALNLAPASPLPIFLVVNCFQICIFTSW